MAAEQPIADTNAEELFAEPPPANRRSVSSHVTRDPLMECDGETYRFVETSHPVQVLSGLNSLRQSSLFCDVTICVDNADFLCHRLVLASCSSYFKAMFSANLAERQQDRVSINGVEADMMGAIIDYAYTSEILITKTNVQSLLSAANLLEILPVRDACCHFMDKNMDETNCIGIHCFAEALCCTDLQQKAKAFMLEYFPEVSKQEEMLGLTHKKLMEFIMDDDLKAESEEQVFTSVMRWHNHDKPNRKDQFSEVLEHVRLPLLSPYFLHDCVLSEDIIKQSDRCMELVNEAQKYHLLQDRRLELRSSRTRPRKSSGNQEVIIAVGGEDDKVVLRSVESFDPHTHSWRTLACLPFAVSKHGLVVTGTQHLYMAGGEFPDGSASRSMWRYDPCFDTWLEVASLGVPRSELGLALLDGFIYAIGGWEGSSRLDSVERYNLSTNQWSFVPPMKMAVTSPAAVAHEGLLYVTGGAILEDGDGIDLVQSFNPHTNQWTELSPMIIERSGSAACVLNGYIYIIGGWHASTENTNKVERYNPRTDTWELRASMIERRYRPGVAVVDGLVYVCGGEEGWDRYHDTIERYNEDTNSWEIIGEMPTSRSWLSCITMTMQKEMIPSDTSPSTCIV